VFFAFFLGTFGDNLNLRERLNWSVSETIQATHMFHSQRRRNAAGCLQGNGLYVKGK